MDSMHYVGLDVHKETISYCIRRTDGKIVHEGVVAANRVAVSEWITGLPELCGRMPLALQASACAPLE